MFSKIFLLLSPLLGTYLRTGNKKTPAISQAMAITSQVSGLEVVILDPTISVPLTPGSADMTEYEVTIALTQWPGGKETILEAVGLILKSSLGYSYEAKPISIVGQDGLRRYLVSFTTSCFCEDEDC